MSHPNADAPIIPEVHVPDNPVWPALGEAATKTLKADIKKMLQEQNAVLVAHYYTDGEIQDLAEETGGCVADSLEMARFGTEHAAETLVVAGRCTISSRRSIPWSTNLDFM